MRASLRLAEQKREAAEALWLVGSSAESLKLAADAFEAVAGIAAERKDAALDAAVERGRSALASTKVPSFDDEVKKEHDALFRDLLAWHDELHRGLAPSTMSKTDVRDTKRKRIFGAVAGAIGFVRLVYFLVHTPKTLRAEGASYGALFPASAAVDGDPKTEWLLPNQTPGYLDVQVLPARPLRKVRLLNAKNPPYHDRGTLNFHLEAYSKGRVVKSVEAKFDGFSSADDWREVEIGGSDPIDRLRIDIKTYHSAGGGFGEIEVF